MQFIVIQRFVTRQQSIPHLSILLPLLPARLVDDKFMPEQDKLCKLLALV